MSQLGRHRGTLSIKGPSVNSSVAEFIDFVPDDAKERRLRRDQSADYHITVATASEVSLASQNGVSVPEILDNMELLNNIHFVGLVKTTKGEYQGWYVLVHSEWADCLRERMNLPPKDFHVTLGFSHHDLHFGTAGIICEILDFAKPISYRACESIVNNICNIPSENRKPRATIEKEVRLVKIAAHNFFQMACSPHVMTMRALGRWVSKQTDPSLAGLMNDIGYFLLKRGVLFGLRMLILNHKRLRGTEYTHELYEHLCSNVFPVTHFSFREEKAIDVPEILHLLNYQLGYMNPKVRIMGRQYGYFSPISIIQSKNSLTYCTLPRNFSWVQLPGETEKREQKNQFSELLAGSAYPTTEQQIAAMFAVGIRSIVTLHENPFSTEMQKVCCLYNITCHFWHVLDRTPPTMNQLIEICDVIHLNVRNKHGTLVHCQGGVGRTNTAIIAYLMRSQVGLSAREAIENVRNQRKIILSHVQESFLKSMWYNYANNAQEWRANSSYEFQTIPTPECRVPSLGLFGKLSASLQLPPVVMLCGTAGSGKSTFSKAMVAAFPENCVRVNKDEMRKKGQCDEVLFDSMRKFKSGVGDTVPGVIILDNCNLTKAVRKEWLASVHHIRVWCVHFNTDIALCKHRIYNRAGHPTIPQGSARGASIIDAMISAKQVPQETEGFERVITLETQEDVAQLLQQWRIPFTPPAPLASMQGKEWNEKQLAEEEEEEGYDTVVNLSDVKLLKFPRTPHIVNLGAATRDDKVLGLDALRSMLDRGASLVVEEKLDGANMGLSIDPLNNQLMVQNRSHYVSSKYHPQFHPLDKWLQRHSAELYSVLVPGRHVLYGEWLYATHSVYYNNLPDYFIAYDIFDRVEDVFYSRKRLLRTLADTSIVVAPVVFEGVPKSCADVLAMVQGPSEFIDVTTMTSADELACESKLAGKREGVVVRECEKGRLVSRAKLVRDDFIAGNERWNKLHKLATNKIGTFRSSAEDEDGK